MKESKQFPIEFDYKGTQITIEYDEMCYIYLAHYRLGIELFRDQYYALDDAINAIKRQIDNNGSSE